MNRRSSPPSRHHPAAVHRRRVLPLRRRGRAAGSLPGRPRPPAALDYESHATALDRSELGALLVAAGLGLPAEHALISLLALNGLRVYEVHGADIEAMGIERGHRTLVITCKGGKVVTVPLARAPPGPSTSRSASAATGRCSSPQAAGGWTGTAPGGSSAGSPGSPGSPSPSGRTPCGTLSSLPVTSAYHCGMCRKPPPTPTCGPRCVTRAGQGFPRPARHLYRRRLRGRRRPIARTRQPRRLVSQARPGGRRQA